LTNSRKFARAKNFQKKSKNSLTNKRFGCIIKTQRKRGKDMGFLMPASIIVLIAVLAEWICGRID
jgi:hypothetical protein